MSPVDDRAAVLRRRALFLGSTLAALGSCQKSGAPPETAQGPVVAVPEGEREDAGGTEPDATALPARDAGVSTRKGMPSLDIPGGLNETAQSRYEHLMKMMTGAHDLLDEIENGLPKCGVSACEEQWKVVAKKWFQLDDSFRMFYGCGGSSEQAKAYAVRQQEHTEFYGARRKQVEDWVHQSLGDPGWARLQELVNEERRANPRPCLSIACVDW